MNREDDVELLENLDGAPYPSEVQDAIAKHFRWDRVREQQVVAVEDLPFILDALADWIREEEV